MSKTYLSISLIILAIALLPCGLAFTDQGQDGIVVYEIAPTNGLAPLAIVLPSGRIVPGAVTSMIIGSDVPCNTKTIILSITNSNGQVLYSKDVTSLFKGTCITSYVQTTFSAPSTPGDYQIMATFKDVNGAELYTDKTIFTISTDSNACPSGYCTSWTNTGQRYEHGVYEQKTCYLYAQGSCAQSQAQTYRTVCDNGFILQNNACVLKNGAALCGDRVVQTGEECDSGDENGVCPSYCNAFCKKSNCATLPNEKAPDTTDKTPSNLTPIYWLIGGALLIGASYYLWGKRR